MNGRRKIIFLVAESWYFASHRLPIAKACLALGWDVVVITRVQDGTDIAEGGIRVIPIRLRRSGRNPFEEILSLLEIFRIIRREKPDILHSVGLKPVLYGATASLLAKVPHTVSALAGMGYIFMSGQLRIRLIRKVIIIWLRSVLRRRTAWLILQNDDDVALLSKGGVAYPQQIALIRGSGVDLDHFRPTPESPGPVIFALVSRMLADKGVRELVWAARELKRRGDPVQVWLVGAPDPDNPTSLTDRDLRAWHEEGIIVWHGPRDDIKTVWEQAHVCVLPSYREGLPKALLEAAACGRPMITTDVPGCREVVRDGIEGLLVPPNDWGCLVQAISKLAHSPELRVRMGLAARRHAEEMFSIEKTVDLTLDVYKTMLASDR
ncbi:MAG: glycosyltransferase family 4 protein [Phaeospirillum sp.]|nr:glycosyltransferase family 4 protein [Phaeospirillum sp.]